MDKQLEVRVRLDLNRYGDGSIGLAVFDRHDEQYQHKVYRLREDDTVELEEPQSVVASSVGRYQSVDLVAALRDMIEANEAERQQARPDEPPWQK